MGVRLLSVGDRGCTRWLLEQLGFTINRFWYLPAHSSGDEPQVNDDRDLMTTQLQPGGLREGWARNTTILEERHPATAGNMTIPEASPTGSVDIVVVCGAVGKEQGTYFASVFGERRKSDYTDGRSVFMHVNNSGSTTSTLRRIHAMM